LKGLEIIMPEDLVMRSVYLTLHDDTILRQIAHDHHVSKNELIRSAIAAKLEEWTASPVALDKDLELGRRSRV
jgi:hypothetical protein